MSTDAERGREDLLALIEDLRKRLDTMEKHVKALPPGDVDLAVMRSIWEPCNSWHWNGEEDGTLEKFVEVLVQGATVTTRTRSSTLSRSRPVVVALSADDEGFPTGCVAPVAELA